MIYDRIENAGLYRGLWPGLDKALDFAATATADLEVGRHEIDGEAVFALVQAYDTKPAEAGRPEAHEKYVDLQMLLQGEEQVLCGFLPAGAAPVEQRKADDIAFYEAPVWPMPMQPGTFLVLFPTDLHQPGMAVGTPAPAKKLVVKIKTREARA